MSTWKNIHTDPPELHKTSFGLWSDTVLATDGKDVFIGNIAKETGDLFFTGRSADCYECEELRAAEYDLTGWQWMPTTAPEKEKTADEMLRNLGYEKITYNGHVSYDSMVSGDVVAVEDGQATFTDVEGTFAFCVDADVVKATARLIEEMEAKK